MRGLVAGLAACAAMNALSYCERPPARVCSEYFRSDKVFVGRVTEKIPFLDTTHLPPPDGMLDIEGHVLRLEVLQAVKGAVASQEWFYDGNDSGRSGMEVGDTRVIFMRGHSIGTCGPQYRDEQTPLILESINALASRPSSVYLYVAPHFAGDYPLNAKPFLPRSVGLQGTDGVRHTVTPAPGGYAEQELPPGAYRFTTLGLSYGENIFVLRPGECAHFDFDNWSAPWRIRRGDLFMATYTIEAALRPQ